MVMIGYDIEYLELNFESVWFDICKSYKATRGEVVWIINELSHM